MIPVFKPSIRRAELDAVLTCMVNDKIGPEEKHIELSSVIAKYLDIYNGFSLREYRRAIEIALKSMQLPTHSEVYISPLAPGVYLDVIEEQGLIPKWLDCKKESLALDISQINNENGDIQKILIVHTLLGSVPDYSDLDNIQIPIIEDISQGLGAGSEQIKCGSYGKATICSMEHDQIITTGGGAVVAGSNKHAYTQIKQITDTLSKDVLLSDMNATMGLEQMKLLNKFKQYRQGIHTELVKGIQKSSHKQIPLDPFGEQSYYSFPVQVQKDVQSVVKYAKKYDIEVVPAFQNSILSRIEIEDSLPNARDLLRTTLLFPLYPSLSKNNVDHLVKVISTLP